MTTAELLRKAAAALDDGSSPLDNWFLTENGVTIDQAHALAGQLAIGARVVAAGIESPKSVQGAAMLRTMAAEVLKSEEGKK
jgi:hypothetical protein